MTRIKKELVQKKTSSSDRIRRIRDHKKVINSKNVVKVRDTNFKRFLEGTVQEKLNTGDILNNNNFESSAGEYTSGTQNIDAFDDVGVRKKCGLFCCIFFCKEIRV